MYKVGDRIRKVSFKGIGLTKKLVEDFGTIVYIDPNSSIPFHINWDKQGGCYASEDALRDIERVTSSNLEIYGEKICR